MSVEFTVKWLSDSVMIRRMFWSGMPKRRVGFVLTDLLCYVGGRRRWVDMQR